MRKPGALCNDTQSVTSLGRSKWTKPILFQYLFDDKKTNIQSSESSIVNSWSHGPHQVQSTKVPSQPGSLLEKVSVEFPVPSWEISPASRPPDPCPPLGLPPSSSFETCFDLKNFSSKHHLQQPRWSSQSKAWQSKEQYLPTSQFSEQQCLR